MDVEKSNKVKGLSSEKLKAIEKFYHHSAYDRSENKNSMTNITYIHTLDASE